MYIIRRRSVPYLAAPSGEVDSLQVGTGFMGTYTRSPKQDSRLQDFRQGLGCSEIVFS